MFKTYWRKENDIHVALIRTWYDYFESNPLHRETIYNLRDKFDRIGSVSDAYRSGRSVTIHALVEDDGYRRSQFCELFYGQRDDSPEFLITSFGLINQVLNYLAI